MDQQGQFRAAALESGIPDDEIDRFAEHLRLAIRLSGGSRGVPVGQFGGSPRLPVGMDWPVVGGSRLPFVFSVDCAALPKVDGSGLPADGSLLFFLNHEEDHLSSEPGYARVVHVPAGTETEVAEEPTDHEGVGRQYDVSATLVARLPDWFATGAEEDEDEDDLSPFQQQLARDRVQRVGHRRRRVRLGR
ncbi:DUF1963 domain-containing protein [Micromonospora sp. WMMC250]|uniref:DUF1963 domain-containing protein n=1 Tax=Micromonospora sp. WMMC250 TaxID=3014781 RepID=UPI0022B6B98C|nr:DUF1963 domain-containing protein [Micromonospora sp. WMMC250]MCZ7373723.1 DUF1963 domain-containing protein [Micromonospora sp. WMMC250]